MTDHPALRTGVARVTSDIIRNTPGDHTWSILARGGADCQLSEAIGSGHDGSVTAGLLDADTERAIAWLEHRRPDCLLLIGDPGTFAGIASQRRRVRAVCPVAYYHVWDNTPAPTWNRSMYEMCDTIACASTLTAAVTSQVVGSTGRVSYVPHGVDLTRFTPREGDAFSDARERAWALYVGANQRRKNVTALVRAFAEADASNDSLLVVRAGDGAADVEAQAAYHGISESVRVMGAVSDRALRALYKAAHVVVNPAYREGFGLTTLEAGACGALRISARTGGLADQIDALPGHSAVKSHVSYAASGRVAEIREDRIDVSALAEALDVALSSDDAVDDRGAIRDARMTAQDMAQGVARAMRRAASMHTPPKRYFVTSV